MTITAAALLDEVIEELYASHTSDTEAAAAARREYEQRRGKVHQDDELWEAWSAAFVEWYVIERASDPVAAKLRRADALPPFHFETRNVPSISNAMGIKGAGEAGSIGSSPAVMNAVVDALGRSYGITAMDMPATPEKVWSAIQAARG